MVWQVKKALERTVGPLSNLVVSYAGSDGRETQNAVEAPS